MPKTLNTAVENVAVELLKVHPRNANQGDIQAITESVETNGFWGTIVVNRRTNHVLAGNHRYMAAKQLGFDTVPVAWVDVAPKDEIRILVADNRTTRLGTDNDARLSELLTELATTDLGLDGTGFTAADLDDLIAKVAGTWDSDIADRADDIKPNSKGLRHTLLISCDQAEAQDVTQAVTELLADFATAKIEA
jgi:ParB-like chromosome segregation protein Spo0J